MGSFGEEPGRELRTGDKGLGKGTCGISEAQRSKCILIKGGDRWDQ